MIHKKFHLTISFFLVACLNACDTKLLVRKTEVVKRSKGVAVFIDRRKTAVNRSSGDVFIDSLIPDFFIPYNFPKSIVQKQQLVTALDKADGKKAVFFYLKGDCNGKERSSSIERECTPLTLDQPLDHYLQSTTVFLLPAEFTFLRNNTNREYFEISKEILLKYSNRVTRMQLEEGYFDVLRMDVLEYKWE